ncbi:diaminopimelate decarboxylase [Brachionus plicatilis]|uniref:Diaminopimelate decarboxylase n=1 Tax=Brachionus plicatilis TaxID=10195 RepID=A0A3M7QGE8_BRAPC|nr:diaminopimelate decarboxylase [Brachionus plicatilis]
MTNSAENILNGSFYFNSANVLSVNQTPLNDLVQKFLSNDEIDFSKGVFMEEGNKLVPFKSQLTTPLYVYSKKRLLTNFLNYKKSFQREITHKFGIDTNISYSIKANFNPSILKLFHQNGCWASLVNKNELLLAQKIGIKGENLIFNGNGKKLIEIELAIKNKCFLNIDSWFNLNDTIKIAKKLRQNESLKSCFPVRLLLRINQNENANVHQYLNTSGDECKFGIRDDQIDELINIIKANDFVQLSGFHSHLGSTIKTLDIYNECVKNLIQLINSTIEKHNIETIELINFGGGLGINYEKFASRTSMSSKPEIEFPTPSDLAKVIAAHVTKLKNLNVKIVVEPGRSLVGDSCILLTKLLGLKKNGNKNFLVVDSSMCECIRPCLYSAYHHIEYLEPLSSTNELFDIVGPVCESGDFLGKDRLLQIPKNLNDNHVYLAIMDVGAYCSSMALNYNIHTKPAEVFIEEIHDTNEKITKNEYFLTRNPESLEDVMACFTEF